MADAPKKLSTAEILAKARAEMAKARGEGPAEPTPAAEPEAAAPAPAPKAAVPKPAPAPAAGGAKPQSTADILAAARAEAARKAAGESPAGETAPAPEAAPAAPAGKPKSTGEILAAARSSAGTAPAAAAPAAAGAKPKSTAEILAAARAQKTGGAAPAAPGAEAAAPAAAKPAPKGKAATTTAVATEGMSVEQMLAAVRPAEVPAAKPAPAKAIVAPPPMPARPIPAKKAEVSRRGLMGELLSYAAVAVSTPFAIAWSLFALWSAGAALFTARFMLPNVLTEPPRKFKIGPPSDYDLGTVATKWVAAYGVWIVHTDQYQGKNLIYALASVCTHLGCTPSWLEGEQKFKCPCHGSGFYITGVNFEGPAPRPLERVGIRLAEDGMLEVDKSLKFQEEMGQWMDANSFVGIA